MATPKKGIRGRLPLLRATLTVLVLSGCGESSEPANPYTGNMSDYTWANQVTSGHVKRRVNGRGRNVVISEFRGKFVWADYAAPWCPPCVAQTRAIVQLEKELHGQNIVFLTVMTSDEGGYGDEPGVETARNWAARSSLDPERVVAAAGLTGWAIPSHVLYSPEGQTLYRSTGSLSADRIKTILFDRMNEWNRWKTSSEVADWMWFNE